MLLATTPVGTVVRKAAIFGGGLATVTAVQFLALDGSLSETPTPNVQFILDDEVAFAPQHLELP